MVDTDVSVDVIVGDRSRGLADFLYLEAHVSVHVAGVGPVQLRATSRLPVPPPPPPPPSQQQQEQQQK